MGYELEEFARNEGPIHLFLAVSGADPNKQYENPPVPFIVTHIPRTAGTTLDNIIRAVGGARSSLYARALGTIYDQFLGEEKQDASEHIIKLGPKIHQNLQYLIGHVPFGIHEKLGYERAIYAVVLRNPNLRVFSQIKLSHRELTKMGEKEILNAIDQGHIVDNTQVRIIAGCTDPSVPCDDVMLEQALHNLKYEYTYVGFQERFNNFLLSVIQGEQWPSILFMSKHYSRPTEITVPAHVTKRLAPYVEQDWKLYNNAQTMFGFDATAPRVLVTVEPDAIQSEVRTDTTYFVKPHTLMGFPAATIPQKLLGGVVARLNKNGIKVKQI